MKKNITYLAQAAMALLLLCFSTRTFAQTQGTNLVLQVTIDGVDYFYNEGDCGYGTANWGGTLSMPDDEFCADVAWGYDVLSDSIACDSIPVGSLTGKIAMIRRATCEFGFKAFNAERAGAVAVLIANGTASTHGGDCAAPGMAAGVYGAQVTIPVVLIARVVANQIDAALKAGSDIEICFRLPNVSSPYVSAAYATPSTQVDSIDLMSFVAYNRTPDTIFDMTIKAEITGPNGYSNTIENATPPLPPGFADLVFFSTYLPPSVPGKYDVVITNNKFAEGRDTLRRSYEITDYTYAVDNLNVTNASLTNDASFQAGGLLYQTGALYFTGPNGGIATYGTFGLTNAPALYVDGNPAANAVQVLLYDADSDEDGVLNFQGGAFGDLADAVVALATYTIDGTETFDKALHVALEDFNISGVPPTLKANHAYYISLLYDGTENGSGICPGFSGSGSLDYLVYDGNALTTPLVMDATYSGWSGGTIVNRLQLDGFTPESKTQEPNRLDASKFSITPNPGNEFVNLNLDLAGVNKQVLITILTPAGQVVRSQNLNDFQSGQVRFEVKDVPSGTYLMWIRTEEGVTVQKVAICH